MNLRETQRFPQRDEWKKAIKVALRKRHFRVGAAAFQRVCA